MTGNPRIERLLCLCKLLFLADELLPLPMEVLLHFGDRCLELASHSVSASFLALRAASQRVRALDRFAAAVCACLFSFNMLPGWPCDSPSGSTSFFSFFADLVNKVPANREIRGPPTSPGHNL